MATMNRCSTVPTTSRRRDNMLFSCTQLVSSSRGKQLAAFCSYHGHRVNLFSNYRRYESISEVNRCVKMRVSSPSSSSAASSSAASSSVPSGEKLIESQASPMVRQMPLGEFSTPPFEPIPNAGDYLEVPSLRQNLKPQPSPLLDRRDSNLLGYEGFVSDDDRVMLQALAFGSQESAGATCVNGMSVDDVCIPLPLRTLLSVASVLDPAHSHSWPLSHSRPCRRCSSPLPSPLPTLVSRWPPPPRAPRRPLQPCSWVDHTIL